MNITAQSLLTDYEQTAHQVIQDFETLSPEVQKQHELANSVTYWFVRACHIGLGIVASTPPQFSNTGGILVIDTWDWIPPGVRSQMADENHVLYQAWQEVSNM